MIYKEIDKFSLRYHLLKYYVDFAKKNFYQEFHVTGLENVPDDAPLLIAPNHQNALMDALAILKLFERPVFLGRSDIFKNKTVASILNFLRIMPVYRIRDGKDKLRKNKEIFLRSVEVLKNKVPLVIFPEARHNNKRQLLPIKKGTTRIALQAEIENNWEMGMYIIPVGIYYSNYTNVQSIIQINFGKPIAVKKFQEIYNEKPEVALNKLREEIAARIKPLIINIETDEYYDTYENMRIIFRSEMMQTMNLSIDHQPNRFKADKKTIALLDKLRNDSPKEMKILDEKVTEYDNGVKKLNLRDWIFRENKFHFLSLLIEGLLLFVLLPVQLYGLINNYIPYKLPQLITRNIKDKQFHSSIHFGVWLVLFPVYYLILFFVAWIVVKSLPFALLYFFSLPVTGMFTFYYWTNYVKYSAKLRYSIRRKGKKVQHLLKLRNEIIENMKAIMKKYDIKK